MGTNGKITKHGVCITSIISYKLVPVQLSREFFNRNIGTERIETISSELESLN